MSDDDVDYGYPRWEQMLDMCREYKLSLAELSAMSEHDFQVLVSYTAGVANGRSERMQQDSAQGGK